MNVREFLDVCDEIDELALNYKGHYVYSGDMDKLLESDTNSDKELLEKKINRIEIGDCELIVYIS